jgi:hypothetical protein
MEIRRFATKAWIVPSAKRSRCQGIPFPRPYQEEDSLKITSEWKSGPKKGLAFGSGDML